MPLKGTSDVLLCGSDICKRQCSQHQADRAAFSFLDLGIGVLPESVVMETALELAGLGPAGVNDREIFSDYRFTFS